MPTIRPALAQQAQQGMHLSASFLRALEVLQLDASALVARSGRTSYQHVLNGIAFAPDRNSFFVTGKHWPRLFEVRFRA